QIAIGGEAFDPQRQGGVTTAGGHERLAALGIYDPAHLRLGARRSGGQGGEPSGRLLPHGDPHGLRIHASNREQLEVVAGGELGDLLRAYTYAIPSVVGFAGWWKPVDLAVQK